MKSTWLSAVDTRMSKPKGKARSMHSSSTTLCVPDIPVKKIDVSKMKQTKVSLFFRRTASDIDRVKKKMKKQVSGSARPVEVQDKQISRIPYDAYHEEEEKALFGTCSNSTFDASSSMLIKDCVETFSTSQTSNVVSLVNKISSKKRFTEEPRAHCHASRECKGNIPFKKPAGVMSNEYQVETSFTLPGNYICDDTEPRVGVDFCDLSPCVLEKTSDLENKTDSNAKCFDLLKENFCDNDDESASSRNVVLDAQCDKFDGPYKKSQSILDATPACGHLYDDTQDILAGAFDNPCGTQHSSLDEELRSPSLVDEKFQRQANQCQNDDSMLFQPPSPLAFTMPFTCADEPTEELNPQPPSPMAFTENFSELCRDEEACLSETEQCSEIGFDVAEDMNSCNKNTIRSRKVLGSTNENTDKLDYSCFSPTQHVAVKKKFREGNGKENNPQPATAANKMQKKNSVLFGLNSTDSFWDE